MSARGNYEIVNFYQSKIGGVLDGFDTFSEKGLYYFTCNKKGKVCLISEGYTSSSARNRGIHSVSKNLLLATQYNFEKPQNEKYFFILKAGNNQEIARSKNFDSEDEMNAFIGWVIGKRFSSNFNEESPELENDFENIYEGTEAGITGIYNSLINYNIFKGTNGKQYFSFKNSAGKTLLLNTNVRGYENIAKINEILKDVIQFAPNINNYDFKLTKNGKYYFYLKDNNTSNIAKSTFFASEEEMMGVINDLTYNDSKPSEKKPNISVTKNIAATGLNKGTIGSSSNLKNTEGKDLKSESPLPVKQEEIKKPSPKIEEPVNNSFKNAESADAVNDKNKEIYVDDFAEQLKLQQQAELEVRLKREKEEKERKEEQNEYAKANAEVLRKHKKEQSIELDENLPIANSKTKNTSVAKKENTVVGNIVKPADAKKKKGLEPVKSNEKKTADAKVVQPKQVVKPEIVKKPLAEKPNKLERPKVEPKVNDEKKSKKPGSNQVPNRKKVNDTASATSSTQKNSAEKPKAKKEVDHEIEIEKQAAQDRLNKLKVAAEERKKKQEKEQEVNKGNLKDAHVNADAKTDKKSYDWWTKDSSQSELDNTIDEPNEPFNLNKALKPAIAALLVLALLFAGYWSVSSLRSNKKEKIADTAPTANENKLTSNIANPDATIANEANNKIEQETESANADLVATNNSENVKLKENPEENTVPSSSFNNFENGTIERHMIDCINSPKCPQARSFQWGETNFRLNSPYISPDAINSLDNIARIMKKHSKTKLEIFGHVAANEQDGYNNSSLSEIRAKQVYNMLVERGISSNRLTYKGMGKSRPINPGNSFTAHYQNRRTELVLVQN